MTTEPVQQPEVEQEEVAQKVTSKFQERAVLAGHNQAITSLQVSTESDLLVSGSRDRTALVWRLPKQQENWATEYTRLVGHNHFVSGVSFSSDASHLLTCSWDKTIRLWDLSTRSTKKLFLDHKKDVLAATFSPSNRRIISCARDKSVRVWNILGECKVSVDGDAWATSVACTSADEEETKLTIAVGYWDGKVKVFEITDKCEPRYTIDAHQGRVSSVGFTPDGQWLITAGSDRKVCLWSVANGQKTMSFTAPAPVNAIACCPSKAWVCAATYEGIAVWDIQAKTMIDLVQPDFKPLGKREAGRTPDCTAIAWQEDGAVLYSGYNNGEIRVWEVRSE